jgi:zinc and cadmium transporter
LINVLSALATTVSAVIFYLIGEAVEISFAPLLAIVAGFFIYIAASDLIPSIHHEKDRKKVLLQSAVLLAGILIVWVVVSSLHGVIE